MIVQTDSEAAEGKDWEQMDDRLQERYGLVTERLKEIRAEQAEAGGVFGEYWSRCASRALKEAGPDMRYAEYAYCRDRFGSEAGKYYCFLYSLLLSVSGWSGSGQTELCCICCELAVQLFLMSEQEENISAVRDTMYWFCSDYCELFIQYQIRALQQGKRFCFGGPLLITEEEGPLYRVRRQHGTDYGLYMGSRFQERYVQGVMSGYQTNPEGCIRLLELIALGLNQDQENGFGATRRQRECAGRLCDRIRNLTDGSFWGDEGQTVTN